MKDIAERIDAHLKRFEADPSINVKRAYGLRFYHAGAWSAGRYVYVNYIAYQNTAHLTRDEAERYLALLDAGSTDRHYEAFRATE